MRTNVVPVVGRLLTDETVGAVLSATHDIWVEEARQFLLPATVSDAPFWERWSAVRYLNDQFIDRYDAERELLAELRPFVPVQRSEMLAMGGERVAELRLALDRVGRRRGTAAEFARAAAEFLGALELWCAELELAGSRVQLDALPPEAHRILGYLEGIPRMCGRASA
jgi:hypothetical protein